jgi:hypothetical protein
MIVPVDPFSFPVTPGRTKPHLPLPPTSLGIRPVSLPVEAPGLFLFKIRATHSRCMGPIGQHPFRATSLCKQFTRPHMAQSPSLAAHLHEVASTCPQVGIGVVRACV